MPLLVESFKKSALESWNNTAPEYFPSGTSYSIEQQMQKEHEVDRLMHSTEEYVGGMESSPIDTRRKLLSVRSRIQKAIVQLLHSFDCAIEDEMERSFSAVMDDFIKQAYLQ